MPGVSPSPKVEEEGATGVLEAKSQLMPWHDGPWQDKARLGARASTALSVSSCLGTVATLKKQGLGETGARTRWVKAGRAIMGLGFSDLLALHGFNEGGGSCSPTHDAEVSVTPRLVIFIAWGFFYNQKQ